MTTMTCGIPCTPGAPVYQLASMDPPAPPYMVHPAPMAHLFGASVIAIVIMALCVLRVAFAAKRLNKAVRSSGGGPLRTFMTVALGGLIYFFIHSLIHRL